jgi:Holliday junction resolvasome RuvABC endonuclease subunit
MNDVTIDNKKQAGLTVQTPVTDLEAILARYIQHYTAVSNVFFKKNRTSMILCQQVTCFR